MILHETPFWHFRQRETRLHKIPWRPRLCFTLRNFIVSSKILLYAGASVINYMNITYEISSSFSSNCSVHFVFLTFRLGCIAYLAYQYLVQALLFNLSSYNHLKTDNSIVHVCLYLFILYSVELT